MFLQVGKIKQVFIWLCWRNDWTDPFHKPALSQQISWDDQDPSGNKKNQDQYTVWVFEIIICME